jgi:hypothetical protein
MVVIRTNKVSPPLFLLEQLKLKSKIMKEEKSLNFSTREVGYGEGGERKFLTIKLIFFKVTIKVI